MPKRLNGSAQTGKKIMNNMDLFSYSYIGQDKDFYKFSWTFGSQSGTAVIILTDDRCIDQSSTLNCNKNEREFNRPLGAYNDNSLYDVFSMMLNSQNIPHK